MTTWCDATTAVQVVESGNNVYLQGMVTTPPSRYPLTPVEGQISRIVPTLMPGAAVTTTRAHVHYRVTEYGRAMLLGLSLAERARSLINIAAPQFREQLERAAYDLHLFS